MPLATGPDEAEFEAQLNAFRADLAMVTFQFVSS